MKRASTLFVAGIAIVGLVGSATAVTPQQVSCVSFHVETVMGEPRLLQAGCAPGGLDRPGVCGGAFSAVHPVLTTLEPCAVAMQAGNEDYNICLAREAMGENVVCEKSAAGGRKLVGNDHDAHGCKASAGFSWCPMLNQCVRSWETLCPATCDKDADCAAGQECLISASFVVPSHCVPRPVIPPATAKPEASPLICCPKHWPKNGGIGPVCRPCPEEEGEQEESQVRRALSATAKPEASPLEWLMCCPKHWPKNGGVGPMCRPCPEEEGEQEESQVRRALSAQADSVTKACERMMKPVVSIISKDGPQACKVANDTLEAMCMFGAKLPVIQAVCHSVQPKLAATCATAVPLVKALPLDTVVEMVCSEL